MKRATTKPGAAPGGFGRGARRALGVVLTLAAVVGLVYGVRWLGELARRGIGERDRYSVRFTDIESDTPPGIARIVFLVQVKHYSKIDETVQSLDPGLAPKLTAAFAKHPLVAKVDEVSVEPPGTIRVKLKFREPALAVVIASGRGSKRVADTAGVLLPITTDANGLPELLTPVLAPVVAPGQPWPDESVKRAVELVAAHHPRTIEKTTKGWRLSMGDGQIVWVEK